MTGALAIARTRRRELGVGLLSLLAFGPAAWAHTHKPKLARITYIRDWVRYPAIVERDTSAQIVALGDVHGGYERLVKLLTVGALIKADTPSRTKYSWCGGNRVLVCTGDLIDKGDQSIPVLELFMALEGQARAAGGELIITLGNHEAEFLAKPERKKATNFDEELAARHIDPEQLRSSASSYGVWMMNRPLAARVNGWFFAHGGHTSGKGIPELSDAFRKAVNAGEWGSYAIVGERSILEDQKWWRRSEELDANLKGLHVAHIVFGHDPGATKPSHEGPMGTIAPKYDGKIFPIDVGMSPAINMSRGALLLLERNGGLEVATALTADGTRSEIWRGPAQVRH